MSINENFTSKRIHDKKNHKYKLVLIDNSTGKRIGKTDWHGTNEKGKKSNEQAKKEVVSKYYKGLTKKEMSNPLENYKTEGFVIPQVTNFSTNNIRFPFQYEIKLNVEYDEKELKNCKNKKEMDALRYKTIMINEEHPLTQEQIKTQVEDIIKKGQLNKPKDYKIKGKDFKVAKLWLKKDHSYQSSYLIKKEKKSAKRSKKNGKK